MVDVAVVVVGKAHANTLFFQTIETLWVMHLFEV